MLLLFESRVTISQKWYQRITVVMYWRENRGIFLAYVLSLLCLSTSANSTKISVPSILKNRFDDPIRDAVLKDDITHIKSVLKGNGSSPSQNDTWNVARISAEIGKVDIFRYVVEMEPAVLAFKNERNETVVHIAAKNGRLDLIRYIAEERPRIFNEDSETIADIAANYNRMSVVLFVAQRNDAVCAKKYGRGNGTSIIILAAVRHLLDLESLKFFVEKKHFNLSTAVTEKDETIAHLAVKNDNLDLVRYMLDREPKLSRLEDGNRKILIELALRGGNLKMVGFILKSMGSPVDQRELKMYCQIAHMAVAGGKVNLIKLILRIYRRILEEKCIGGTLAHVAAAHGRWDMLEYLATEKPSMLTQRGFFGWNTPLHFLALKNDSVTTQFMEFLVKETGEAAFVRNVHGKTVPEIAAENGNLGMIKCIIKELPWFNDSCRVAEISIEYGHPNIFWYIVQRKPAELADETLLSIAFVERLLRVETLQKEGAPLVENKCCASMIAHIAAENDDLAVIQYIAKRNPSAVAKKDKDGNTILNYATAAEAMSKETSKALMEDISGPERARRGESDPAPHKTEMTKR